MSEPILAFGPFQFFPDQRLVLESGKPLRLGSRALELLIALLACPGEILSKEELIRKQMLGKMQRSEFTQGRNVEIRAWVEEHPEIKAKIEERIRNVPEANRERAFINAAKTVHLSVPLVVRLEGTNVEKGKKLLKESSVELITADDLADAAQKAVAAAKKK